MRNLTDYWYIVNYQARIAYQKIPEIASRSISLEDFEQEGCIAFIRACRTFDESRETSFETYLTKMLINAFASQIAHLCLRKRLPMFLITSLEQIASDRKYEQAIANYERFEDPQFEFAEFRIAIERIWSDLSAEGKRFAAWLLDDSPQAACTSKLEISRHLKMTRYRVQRNAETIWKRLGLQ